MTRASKAAHDLVGSFSYMLPDTEDCREKVALAIDAALEPLKAAVRVARLTDFGEVAKLNEVLAPWEHRGQDER